MAASAATGLSQSIHRRVRIARTIVGGYQERRRGHERHAPQEGNFHRRKDRPFVTSQERMGYGAAGTGSGRACRGS